LKLTDRLKIAFAPKNAIFEVLQRYAEDFLNGKDVPTENSIIDASSAMKYTAVFACVRVLSETLASCPIFQYEKTANGGREAVTDTSESEILHYAPNPDMTPGAFKESIGANINLGGDFFAQKVRSISGNLIQLRPIVWHRVRIDVDKTTGQLLYFVDGSTNAMTRADILHIPGITIDGYHGITPIEYAQSSLKVGLYQNTFTEKFYENGVTTSGVFEHPNVLQDEAFQRLKKDLTENYAGLKNAGVPMILEDGMKYREVTMKLSDAQFIESKRFSKEDIASLFRVPLHLIGDLSRSTNNNIEHQSLEFIIYTMLPWFKRCEENFNLQLLRPEDRRRGRYFEFKLDALLRGDAKTRAEAYAQGRQWGWLSVNDIRRMENMSPIPNGDIYLQPLNMGEAGKIQQQDQLKAMTEEIFNMLSKKE
jgi:HK97 family phage portal protein